MADKAVMVIIVMMIAVAVLYHLLSLSYPASLYGTKTTPSSIFDTGLALLIITRCVNE